MMNNTQRQEQEPKRVFSKRYKDLSDLKTGQVSPQMKFRNDELNSKARGLTHIRWVHQSLEDLPKLGLGNFDFIECREVPIIKHFDCCFASNKSRIYLFDRHHQPISIQKCFKKMFFSW